jgi:DNA-binding NarL/FixJ family response regulator
MTARILIVDDRAVVRAELRTVLELVGGISVAGEAADGWEAIRQAQVLKPDIVLMDLEMPGLDGLEATRRIKALRMACAVIVLTVYGDAFSQKKAKEAGADEFIVKGTDLCTILEIIERFSGQERSSDGSSAGQKES